MCASSPHGIQLVLNSLGNMGMGIDMQHDDIMNEFISKILLDLRMQLLRHMTELALTVSLHDGSLNVKEHSHYYFTSECL